MVWSLLFVILLLLSSFYIQVTRTSNSEKGASSCTALLVSYFAKIAHSRNGFKQNIKGKKKKKKTFSHSGLIAPTKQGRFSANRKKAAETRRKEKSKEEELQQEQQSKNAR